jgi:acetyl-CoA carboxylase biotin carboxyl carrier protein
MTHTSTKSLQPLSEIKNSQHLILSPAVGYYSTGPKPGSFLTRGSFIGKLKVLNTFYHLYLPDDIYGQVVIDEEKDNIIPIEYGQELFRLNPEKDFVGSGKQPTGPDPGTEEVDTSEEGYVVTAFTTGIFYARPSPDSPPFVTLDQEIEKGKALGLIEVMKTFNHIIFQGTDDSDTGRIKKIYVKDSQEVKLGQPLFLIE